MDDTAEGSATAVVTNTNECSAASSAVGDRSCAREGIETVGSNAGANIHAIEVKYRALTEKKASIRATQGAGARELDRAFINNRSSSVGICTRKNEGSATSLGQAASASCCRIVSSND